MFPAVRPFWCFVDAIQDESVSKMSEPKLVDEILSGERYDSMSPMANCM